MNATIETKRGGKFPLIGHKLGIRPTESDRAVTNLQMLTKPTSETREEEDIG